MEVSSIANVLKRRPCVRACSAICPRWPHATFCRLSMLWCMAPASNVCIIRRPYVACLGITNAPPRAVHRGTTCQTTLLARFEGDHGPSHSTFHPEVSH